MASPTPGLGEAGAAGPGISPPDPGALGHRPGEVVVLPQADPPGQPPGEVVVLSDADHRIVWISSGAPEVLGLGPVEAPEDLDAAAALLHADDAEPLRELADAVRARPGEVAMTTVRMRTADGSWHPVELSCRNLLDDDGQGVIVTVLRTTAAPRSPAAVIRSEARFRALIRNAADVTAIVGRDGRIAYVSPSVERLTGYRPEELLATSSMVLTHPDDTAETIGRFEALVRGQRSTRFEHRLLHRDGTVRWVETTTTDRLDDPDVRGVVVNVRDITTSKQAREDLERSEQSFRSLAASSPIGIIRVEPSGRLTYVNDWFRAMAGLGPDETPGFALRLIHPDDRKAAANAWMAAVEANASFERRVRFLAPSGEVRWCHIRATPLLDDGQLGGYIGTIEDVSERKAREDRLAHQATHDPLTGLPNRTLLLDRLEVALARSERSGGHIAMLFCDLDRFKAVNDRCGHAVGDQLLVAAAERLRGELRPGDTVARFGGDEFVVLCEDVADRAEAEAIATRLRSGFERPFDIGGRQLRVTISIGVALSGPGGHAGESLIRDADAAMYRAKARGRARHVVYDASMRDEASERLELQEALGQAIARHQLHLLYQPIVDLGTRRVVGVEALARWRRSSTEALDPVQWLDVAEQTGLIVPIGDWVATTAMAAAARWGAACPPGTAPWLALNLSRRQVEHPGLADELVETAARAGLDPGQIVLEVAEPAATTMATAEDGELTQLRAGGMRIALDDVGSRASSLMGLHRFPPDLLKIDRELVAELGRSETRPTGVQALVGLAGSLHIEVVAEGVETELELERLCEVGCNLAQGFHLYPPVELDDLLDLLARPA